MTDEVTYNNDDFVYVDPANKLVIGLVEWDKNGLPKKKEYVEQVKAKDANDTEEGESKKRGKRPRKSQKRYYPWGSYKSMKRIYKLEKVREPEPQKTFEEILPKALEAPFWD